ncbi:MAG: TetR/AcrR family transcriptional regulator [Ignavibacteriaceae bacterium]|nr:TetR/AcrR family transcriptional regulator [Ignavibacteriaceae bacterium]MCW8813761.1 TetR/AcrR family transcriptional regulator [Chlorobium sp.]MCW8994876.1 TetR/AcrR family transcriptional regulator [Psychromonas sp.]MCW9098142.1 TetR/AcrR family transcriptional regulator [Ignavibacteriaceae bacterium]
MDNTKEKTQVILRAARERFAHYGFTKVTMDEIASDVEMGKASLYYYFPAKEDLFRAVIAQEQNQFVDAIEGIISQNISVSKKLVEYVERRVEFFRDLLNLGTLNVHSYFDTKSIYKSLFENFHAQELKLMEKLIEEGKQKGEFKKSLSEDVPQLILHILQGLRVRVLRQLKGRSNDNKYVRQLKEEMSLFIRIFIEGIKA